VGRVADLYDVRISSEAAADLTAIHAYIVQDSPDDAARFLEHLLDSIQSLERLPHRFKVYRRGRQTGRPIRSMPVQPYVVYYQVLEDDGVVRVMTVRHGVRRRPRGLG
jgi:plasmid stabilization system protein ParE